jgi:8-oxo-dGTP pyrophosphatase MutT (NUDIX family)
MTTPSFILELRRHIGHAPLWLMGITAVVVRSDGKLLLARRADTAQWALVYGIIEPAEQPADTACREVKEETGITVRATSLIAVTSSDRMLTYANGDQAQYMDHEFLCIPVSHAEGLKQPGTPDRENTDSGWFDPDNLPFNLAASTVQRLALYRQWKQHGSAAALFVAHGQENITSR